MAKSKKEKGEEILRKRELARKGFAPKVDEDADPLDQEEREKKVARDELAIGLGLKRSG
jgi:hypothetical protein